MSTESSKSGLTYICFESRKDQGTLVCHYNDGDINKHVVTDTNVDGDDNFDKLVGKDPTDPDGSFDYYGYVYDPSEATPDYSSAPTLKDVEGRYFECLLGPPPPPSQRWKPTAFVRWMINPEITPLLFDKNINAIGFPVGWAVRGFLPEELARRNQARKDVDASTATELKNSLNMLPVFCGDYRFLKTKSPHGSTLRRGYWILGDPSAHTTHLVPLPLKQQILDAQGPRPQPPKPDLGSDGLALGTWKAWPTFS